MKEHMTWHNCFSSVRAWFCSVHEKRSYNTLRYPMTNRLLLILYPIFIVCMAELNQDKYPSKLVLFITDHPTIMLFNVLIAGLIFVGALLLFRSGWFSMLLESILYMALSITELFKYNTNGNHLIMTDMKLFRSVKSLTSFAYIKITPRLVLYISIWGYSTAYVHPFQSSFYSRKRIYGQFNFDTMIFEDDFTVPTTTYGEYIDDNVVYNQIESLIASTDEPLYVHATTMQNHQPYTDGDSDDEFVNYLSRLQHSADGLADFLERLSQIDEPTIVLFVGDHFPSLRGDDGIYSQLNITSENCSTLYEQRYILWNNYGLDTSSLPTEAVSAFYAPYLVMDLIDAPRDSFTQSMMNEMEVEPVYSTNYMPMQEADKKLDTLTYDRILGAHHLPSALDVLPDPTEDTTETTTD